MPLADLALNMASMRTQPPDSIRGRVAVAGLALAAIGCTKAPPSAGSGGAVSSGGVASVGGLTAGGVDGGGGNANAGAPGTGGALPTPVPKYHPPAGFESCVHAEVKVDCEDGWCNLPPSCFVMGSPEGEWHRGRDSENQTAVTLTHWIEVQREELTRSEWTEITGLPAPGPEACTEGECPVAMVSWWDAVHAANLLSEQKGLEPCYEPVGCSGVLGQDLACTGVAEPEKSAYECEGYRLPTRAEAEYAARAGTISTFYSGDITVYEDDTVCHLDPALELIAWYCGNSGDRPHVGGELQANGFGLFDMIGNLGEWTNEGSTGASSPGGQDPNGQNGQNARRLRFSPQYDDKNWIARTAGLLSGPWESRGIRTGFRLFRTLPAAP